MEDDYEIRKLIREHFEDKTEIKIKKVREKCKSATRSHQKYTSLVADDYI